MRASAVAVFLGLGSFVSAVVQKCTGSDICFSLSIPDTTVSSGDGDVFFQLSAPTSLAWVALGQGDRMSGSNIFVMYTSAGGTNVTVSPRLVQGYVEPEYNSDAQLELLEGSGVSDGIMTANVKCSSCQSWPGGSMDFTSSSGSWIYAYRSGDSLDTDDTDASIRQHSDEGVFDFDFAAARDDVSASANPFAAESDATVVETSTLSDSSSPDSERQRRILIAHGVLASLVFVMLLPIGAISVRVLSSPWLVKFHAAWQIFAMLVYVAGFGLGVYIADELAYLDNHHPVIGMVIFGVLFFQPILGQLHHSAFKKKGVRTLWSHAHIWLGRTIILVGIVNGGLGLRLADNTTVGKIVYAVVAALMGLAYFGSMFYKKKK
ncbi:MAG: hypothetical protein M1815_002277 [Lichina confinis]|nr:MAG: hypothetical protein M1815_002277 [Lichina confinis]